MAANKYQTKKASPAKKVSDRRLRTAIVKHDGLLTRAANEVGLTRQSVHERVNNNPELFALVQDLRTGMLDTAESVLMHRMKKHKDREAAKFILQNLGRTRGYGPQPEIPPPPPDNSRRATVFNILVQMLDQKALAAHAQPVDVTPAPVGTLNGHAPPANATNGHADPAAQLLAAKKATRKVKSGRRVY